MKILKANNNINNTKNVHFKSATISNDVKRFLWESDSDKVQTAAKDCNVDIKMSNITEGEYKTTRIDCSIEAQPLQFSVSNDSFLMKVTKFLLFGKCKNSFDKTGDIKVEHPAIQQHIDIKKEQLKGGRCISSWGPNVFYIQWKLPALVREMAKKYKDTINIGYTSGANSDFKTFSLKNPLIRMLVKKKI